MPTAHLYRVVQDGAGNVVVGAKVTLCEPGTNQPIADQLFADVDLTALQSNPFTTMDGVIDVYLARGRTVALITEFGSASQVSDYLDILPGAETILAGTGPIEITNDAFAGALLQMVDQDSAQWVGTAEASGAVVEVVPGDQITVDNTDPARPIVSMMPGDATGNIAYQGPWVSGNGYMNSDAVTSSNRLWLCTTGLSSSTVVPENDAAHWIEIAAIHDQFGRLQALDPATGNDLVTLGYFTAHAVNNPPVNDLGTDLGSGANRWRRTFTGALITTPTLAPIAGSAVTIDASKGDALIQLTGAVTSSAIINPVTGQLLRITWQQGGTGYSYSWPPNCAFADGVAPQLLTPARQLTVQFRYDGVSWLEMNRSLTTSHGVPAGGAAGQVLTKNTGTDYDAGWAAATGGGGGGTGNMTYRGPWVSGNAYAIGDVVTAANRSYVCTAATSVASSFVGSTGMFSNVATGATLALPAGCQPGDLAVVALASSQTAILPNGWTAAPMLPPDQVAIATAAQSAVVTRVLSAADISVGQVTIPTQTSAIGWSATAHVFRGVLGMDWQPVNGYVTGSWATSPPLTPSGPGYLLSVAAAVYAVSTPGATVTQPSQSGLVSRCGNYVLLGVGYEPYASGLAFSRTFTASPTAPPTASQTTWVQTVLAGPPSVSFAEIGAVHDVANRLQAAPPAAAADLTSQDYVRRNLQLRPNAISTAVDAGSPTYPYGRTYTKSVVNFPAQQTVSGAVTVNAANGDATLNLVGNVTSTSIINPVIGQILRITVIQDAVGARAFVWPTNTKFADGTTGPVNPAINSQQTVEFRYDGTNWIEISRSAVGGAAGPTGPPSNPASNMMADFSFDQWTSNTVLSGLWNGTWRTGSPLPTYQRVQYPVSFDDNAAQVNFTAPAGQSSMQRFGNIQQHVTPGQVYNLTAWAIASAANSVTLELSVVFNTPGTNPDFFQSGATAQTMSISTLTTGYALYSGQVTVPTGYGEMRAYLSLNCTSGGPITAVVDRATMVPAQTPTTFNGLPVGGAVNTPLIKNTATDFDTKWGAAGQLLLPGGTAGQFLGKNSATDFDAGWLSGLPGSMLSPPGNNWNNVVAPGFYLGGGTVTNSPVANRTYFVLMMRDPASGTATQVAYRATGQIGTGPVEQWQRTYSVASTSWSPWAQVYPALPPVDDGWHNTNSPNEPYLHGGIQAYDAAGIRYASARFRRDAGGCVHLDGLVTNIPASSATTVIFTLPAGYRPAYPVLILVLGSGGQAGIQVNPNGDVILRYSSGAAGSWVALNGMTFMAEDTLTPTWVPLSLTSGWANVAPWAPARYCIDNVGDVHLSGMISGGSSGASNPLFTLPSPATPTWSQTFARIAPTANPPLFSRLDIATNTGQCTQLGGTAGQLTSLEGMVIVNPNGTWYTPALVGSWSTYGGLYADPGWCRNNNGVLAWRGLVKSGAAAQIVAPGQHQYPVKQNGIMLDVAGSGLARIDNYNDGSLGAVSYILTGSNAYVSVNHRWFADS